MARIARASRVSLTSPLFYDMYDLLTILQIACPPSEYTETCLVWSNYQAPSKSKKHHYPAYEGVGADLGEANAP